MNIKDLTADFLSGLQPIEKRNNVKNVNFSFKAENGDETEDGFGIIRGFASTFGNVDMVGDIIDKGAFKKTITESKQKFPILSDHDHRKVIGLNVRAEEDLHGLRVEGHIDLKNQAGLEKFRMAKKFLKEGTQFGLSIGFSIIKAEPDKKNPTIRRIKEVRLYEYSLTGFPANELATVTEVKNLGINTLGVSSVQTLVESIVSKGLEMGLKTSEIIEALHQYEAADDDIQPDPALSQSLDNLIATLKS